jgi:hypothetical protein
VELNVNSFDKKFCGNLTGVLVVQEISSVIRSKDLTVYLTSLGKESSSPIGNGEIIMPIGIDNPTLHIQRDMIYQTDKNPIAVKYDLGWSCFVRPTDKSLALFPNLLLNKKEEHYDIRDIHEPLRKSWTYDQFPTDSLTLDKEQCVKTLTDSYKVIYKRAFVSPLFKPGQPQPGINNYYYANKRLDSVNNKLTEAEKVVIDGIYGKYFEQGIICKVDINKQKPWEVHAIYWPTIIVHQPKSETTPVRPCCDGKAKHINGKSINELLFLPGPNQMCKLPQVLTRFRQYDVAFTGDISKMFLKIQQPEEYKKYSQVIWLDTDREGRLIYEFSHLFGNNGSPTVAMWCVQKNAHDHRENFPEAAECVLKSTIVDEHLDSCPTATGAIQIVTELVKMYDKIGQKLAKVSTNNTEVLKNLPEAVETSENMKDFSQWGPQEI